MFRSFVPLSRCPRLLTGCSSKCLCRWLFAEQVHAVRLIVAAPNTFSLDPLAPRFRRFRRRGHLSAKDDHGSGRSAGVAHPFVFWGFVAFGGYTLGEFLNGLGLADLTHTPLFAAYRSSSHPLRSPFWRASPFCSSVAPSCARSDSAPRSPMNRRHRPVHRHPDADVSPDVRLDGSTRPRIGGPTRWSSSRFSR